MKILITGVAGFIGFHLVKKMCKNHEIIGLDNINNYYDQNLKFSRLEELGIQKKDIFEGKFLESVKNINFTFVKLDISDKKSVDLLFSSYKFDVVVNLAAQAGVRYSIDNPSSYIESNIVGFFNILEGCRHHNIKRLIYASSSSVYGNSKEEKLKVTDNVDNPISLYAATKKSNELMAYTYSHLYGIETVGLRFFTVYGPYGRPDMAYYKFALKGIKGESIDVYNRGDMYRDFTYIDDIVEGVSRVINISSKVIGEEMYKVYNIGNNNPISLRSFIGVLERKLGVEFEKNYLPMQPGDVYRTSADVDELIKDTAYSPSTTIEEGIESFSIWFKKFYNLNRN
ncbi:MAG: NAD-dependent epimerase [Candidatus Cloacimonadota bacterium]|nr:MAG: NAD-dependent epimerase [Candidatus Cloacimonadota bacterium]PIE78722.1 MAG: NAD-dependent epimerase [Candidatus Delongbacteria bacterium]